MVLEQGGTGLQQSARETWGKEEKSTNLKDETLRAKGGEQ